MTVNLTSNLEAEDVQVETEVYLPEQIFERYISVAMRRAIPRELEGKWYADIPGFEGVWATGESPKQCLDTLEEVLRDWIILKVADRDRDIPIADEIDLTVLF